MTQVSREIVRGHIVIVDDDQLFSESVSRNLIDAGYAARTFSDGASVLEHLAEQPAADVILLDWKMPGMTGIEVLQHLRAAEIDIPVIFLTVLSDQVYEEAGLLGGAVDFIEKSRNFSILIKRIELILCGRKMPEGGAAKGTVLHGRLLLDHDFIAPRGMATNSV